MKKIIAVIFFGIIFTLTGCTKQKSQIDIDIPVTITLKDSNGDGWDGGQMMTITNQESGESFGPFTCPSGYECVQNINLTGPAQYQVNVTSGEYADDEISWEISSQAGKLIRVLAPNGAPFTGNFNLQ